jgi:hypothetical protein
VDRAVVVKEVGVTYPNADWGRWDCYENQEWEESGDVDDAGHYPRVVKYFVSEEETDGKKTMKGQ